MSAKKTDSSSYLGYLGLIFFAFFLQKLVPQIHFWIEDTSVWVFLVLVILFGFKPVYRRFKR